MNDLIFASRRSPVYGRPRPGAGGMVATSQPLAVAAGLEVLGAGGNAADAAVATAAALNVTEPTSTGIGGDCFALYYEASTRRVTALNGSGRAPAGLSLELLTREGYTKELPAFHAHTVTVPGACAGWCDLIERHGRLNMNQVLAPAIRLADEGFPVAPITAYFWARGVERQLRHALNGMALTIEGRAPRAGEIFRNPDLARTFRIVAEGGKKAYYEGDIARDVAAAVQASGGVMTEEDLAAHVSASGPSTWDEPISSVYRGVRVWECPPNGQGLAALLALNILEGFELGQLAPLSAERLHLQIEAMRLAFADTRWFVADPAFNPAPLEALLSKGYAAERRKLLDARRATVNPMRGSPTAGSDTVYLTVVDGEGNACSFINSNYAGFGTGIVPEGRGFTLQNRGHNFTLDPKHPNALAPRKRPYHTIIPAMATREADGSLFASFGVMGGFMQPQGHMQVLCSLVDDAPTSLGIDPQAALDRPRFCITEPGVPPHEGGLALEEGIPAEVVKRLQEMGHPVSVVSGHGRALFGRGQIIMRDASTGVLTGGSDPRADGCAMCL